MNSSTAYKVLIKPSYLTSFQGQLVNIKRYLGILSIVKDDDSRENVSKLKDLYVLTHGKYV